MSFLDIEVTPSNRPAILEHCSFDYMKRHATRSVPLGGAFCNGGAETSIDKGTNGRSKNGLTDDDNRRYEAIARRELGDACFQWLTSGTV